jgi:hypothetical protein
MDAEAVSAVQRVYEAVQRLLATQPADARGVAASQVAAHAGLTRPTVLAAFDLLASRSIVRLAQPADPASVIAIPVRRQLRQP